jgi:hypothetical protein
MIKQLTTTAGFNSKPVYLYNDIYNYYLENNFNINEINSLIEKNWLKNDNVIVINNFKLSSPEEDNPTDILKEIEGMKILLDKIENDIDLEYE